MTTFYLGIHETSWMNHLHVPVMVSRRRLRRNGIPRTPTGAPWVLDSGGFTELHKHGRWTVTADEYEHDICEFSDRLPGMVWAAPRDWMCEATALNQTGLSIREHQHRTTADYLDLTERGLPVIPVLQGQSVDDYVRHVADYTDAGVALADLPTVGLGSVCRRESTKEIRGIITELHAIHGLRLHGFGCKTAALRHVNRLASADSMAWSRAGRESGPCTHLDSRCANHKHYALEWRHKVLAAAAQAPTPLF